MEAVGEEHGAGLEVDVNQEGAIKNNDMKPTYKSFKYVLPLYLMSFTKKTQIPLS